MLYNQAATLTAPLAKIFREEDICFIITLSPSPEKIILCSPVESPDLSAEISTFFLTLIL